MLDLRPTLDEDPYFDSFNNLWGVSHNTDGTLKSNISIKASDYGADPTATTYSDTAFAQALAAAAANVSTYGRISVALQPGTYKFGSYATLSSGSFFGPSLVIPSKRVQLSVPGGAAQSARLYFPNETSLPTAVGYVTAATVAGQTTLPLTNVKNAFAPASAIYPQTVIVGNATTPITYTGITGSGTSVTLTGVTGLTDDRSGNVVVGNTAILCMGAVQGVWSLDNTILVQGPGTGSFNAWNHASTLNGSASLPQATIPIASTSGWPTSGGTVMISDASGTGTQAVTYTGFTGNSLTGCTGGAGTSATASQVIYCTPPNALDGIYIGARGGIDCAIQGFRHLLVDANDHTRVGPNYAPSAGYSYYCLESPVGMEFTNVDSGNQLFAGGIDWHGAYWSAFYIAAGNALLAATVNGGNTFGFSPWVFWKEATLSVTGADQRLTDATSVIRDASFEGAGLGIAGCPDGNAGISAIFDNCNTNGIGAADALPGSSTAIAEFNLNLIDAKIRGGSMFANPGAAYPYFQAKQVTGEITGINLSSFHMFILGRAKLGSVPTWWDAGDTRNYYHLTFPGGIIVWSNSATAPAAGSVMMFDTEVNSSFPGITRARIDNNTGSIIGVAPIAFGGRASHWVGAVVTNQQWGKISVRCASSSITALDLVRSDGGVTSGTAKRFTAGDDPTVGPIIGRALASESGGLASILLSPGFC